MQAEKLYIEMDSVERGILQLIADHDIQKLVMGAATDGCYHAYDLILCHCNPAIAIRNYSKHRANIEIYQIQNHKYKINTLIPMFCMLSLIWLNLFIIFAIIA